MKKLIFILTAIVLFSSSCKKEENSLTETSNVISALNGEQYLKYLYQQKVEPFDKISPQAYDLLLNNIVYDEQGELRGLKKAIILYDEIGYYPYVLLIDKLLKVEQPNAKLDEYIRNHPVKRAHPVNDKVPREKNGSWSCPRSPWDYCVGG